MRIAFESSTTIAFDIDTFLGSERAGADERGPERPRPVVPMSERKLGDEALELGGHPTQRLRRLLHVAGAASGILCGYRDTADILSDFGCSLRRLVYIPPDFIGRDGLFFHPPGDVI